MKTWTPQQAGLLADRIDFAKEGRVPVIARDLHSQEILMLGYQDREAFERTLTSGTMHYFSRSKGRLWQKGETSGHTQEVQRVFLDCDADTLLFDVVQRGPGACHTGRFHCFFRRAEAAEWTEFGVRAFDPATVYAAPPGSPATTPRR